MKKEDIFEALSDIDETYIHRAMERSEKKRHSSLFLKAGALAASLMIVAGAAFLLPKFGEGAEKNTEASNDGVFWTDKREHKKDGEIFETQNAREWSWEWIPENERYYFLRLDGTEYSSRCKAVGEEHLGEPLGTAELCGYNEDELKTTEGEIREIKGLDSKKYIAARLPDGNFYVFFGRDYDPPLTLGEFIEEASLDEHLSLSLFRYYKEGDESTGRYRLGDAQSSSIWDMLADAKDAAAVKYDDAVWESLGERISFTAASERLGIVNKSFRICKNGYVFTNVEEYGYAFYIGEEQAGRIIEYCLENKGEDIGEEKKHFIIGTVTEIGTDSFKVDDGISLEDPSEAIVFTVYMDDIKVRREVLAGDVRVGSKVCVYYGGLVLNDGLFEIKDSYEIHEGQYREDGFYWEE